MLRRATQLAALLVFLGLLASAVFATASPLPEDLFLRMDPGLMALTALSGRVLEWAMLPALAVLLSALILGRGFCGWICPMGTTLDGSDALVRNARAKSGRTPAPLWLSRVPRALLTGLLAASAFGISLAFVAAPLSLITRFYGLAAYPALSHIADASLKVGSPLLTRIGLARLAYLQFEVPGFATSLFILGFFLLLFAAGRMAPRFWCRYLCPTGALLGLFSFRPLARRRVTDSCIDCGKCAARCPMNAIPEDPALTDQAACIQCATCQRVCPMNAIRFLPTRSARMPAPPVSRSPLENGMEPISLSRRGFVLSGVAGAGVALAGLASVPGLGITAEKNAAIPPRPPGALPEDDFLARCVRCGECVAACPENAIQPIWLEAGWTGLFSPKLHFRSGPCNPRCDRCGQVCPTGALPRLGSEERIWAKTGTAVIQKNLCLAWELKKKCLVCDEVCPYDAVKFLPQPDSPVLVPHVATDQCAGCGYCEHHCPVQGLAAIRVSPKDALRLPTPAYQAEAQSRGLSLKLRKRGTAPGYPEAGPSFDSLPDGLAPGFSKGSLSTGSNGAAPGGAPGTSLAK